MNRLEKLRAWLYMNRREIAIIAVLLTIIGVAHGYNMFHYPYYESDEGTYMGQAWALVTKGQLAPYTYWYDHAPAGWILIALWSKLTGGFFTFGFSINSGRVLMLVLHLLSAILLYFIAKKLSDNRKLVAVLAVLLFSLSPLAIYFQRRVLLDNIMVFWLLLSLFLLLHYRHKLRYVLFSALAFGIAALSKETAVFFIPVCIFIVYRESDKAHRKFAIAGWIGVTALVISLYAFYALLKGEMFPAGSLLGGSHGHVSLLETLKYQSGRTGGGIFGTGGGSFYRNFIIWMREDPLLIIAGAVSTIGVLTIGIKRRNSLLVGLLALSMWAFLVRGGLVIEFYIIPLIPFISLAIAHLAYTMYLWLKAQRIGLLRLLKFTPYIAVAAMLVLMVGVYSHLSRSKYSIYTSDQTTPQIQAVNWLLSRSRPDQFYAIDMYGYVDIHAKDTNQSYKNAEYYWKVDDDPDIRDKVLHGNYENIDYLMQTPQMRSDFPGLKLMSKASEHSLPVLSFSHDGWGVDVLASRQPHQVLSSSWYSYKDHFLAGGKSVDPQNNNHTTSQSQSYGMLRAVWMNDQAAFTQLYKWTFANLQNSTNTFTALWQPTTIAGASTPKSASDADSDIAMSLLFAANKWHNPSYATQAKAVIAGIWKTDVVEINGKPYMSAGNWADSNDYITVNPSYLSPAAYRMFADVDTSHDWSAVASTSYEVLTKCSADALGQTTSVGLPPDWCRILKSDTSAAPSLDTNSIGSEYSFDALRTSWRVALDYQWYKTPEAKQYLTSLNFLGTTYQKNNKLSVGYNHDGTIWQNYESVIGYAGAMGYFKVVNPKLANTIYTDTLLAKYYENSKNAYWEDPNNAYAQNWAWFGTAMYNDALPNLAATAKSELITSRF